MPSTALGFLVCRSRGWRVLAACEPTGAAFLGGDGLCIWNLTFGVARAARAACAFVSGLPQFHGQLFLCCCGAVGTGVRILSSFFSSRSCIFRLNIAALPMIFHTTLYLVGMGWNFRWFGCRTRVRPTKKTPAFISSSPALKTTCGNVTEPLCLVDSDSPTQHDC